MRPQLGEVKNLFPGSTRLLRIKIKPVKSEEQHGAILWRIVVVVLRGGHGRTHVPDPASQIPPAGGFIVRIQLWRRQWFKQTTWNMKYKRRICQSKGTLLTID